jgi:hypothetical protein
VKLSLYRNFVFPDHLSKPYPSQYKPFKSHLYCIGHFVWPLYGCKHPYLFFTPTLFFDVYCILCRGVTTITMLYSVLVFFLSYLTVTTAMWRNFILKREELDSLVSEQYENNTVFPKFKTIEEKKTILTIIQPILGTDTPMFPNSLAHLVYVVFL